MNNSNKLMEKQPHVLRMEQERNDLNDKCDKLREFLARETFKSLDLDDQFALRCQLQAMSTYLHILKKRIIKAECSDYYKSDNKIIANSKGFEIIGGFGVEENEYVAHLKAAAINYINDIEFLGQNPRRKATAITNVETAQMFAVKSLF